VRKVVVAALVSTLSVLAFPAYLGLRSNGSRAFEPQTFDYVLLAVSTFALALGAQIVPLRGTRYPTVLAVLACAFLLLGFLSMAFFIAFLPAGLLLLLMLYRALSRVPRGSAATRAALGGAAIGFALPLLYVALIIPATVECRDNGGATSSGRWGVNASFRSSARTDTNGVTTGTIEFANSLATYRCEGARLVEFQRTPK